MPILLEILLESIARLAVVTELVAVFLFPFINNVAKSLILLVEKFDG